MLKKILLTSTALIFTAAAALAISGNQIGFPIVGGASYCGSFGNNATCNLTVPAGPTVITGNETIVANTNLPSGQNPQTVLLSMAAIGALPYQYVGSPPTSTTVTIAATVGALVIDPTTTLASFGLILPAASTLSDNQTLEVSSSQTLTSFVITPGSGTTVSNSPTALTISTTAAYGYKFIYNQPLTKWFRLQ